MSFEKEKRVLEHRYSMNQKREKNLKHQKIKRKSSRKRGGDLRAVKFEVFTGKNMSSKAYEKRGREEEGNRPCKILLKIFYFYLCFFSRNKHCKTRKIFTRNKRVLAVLPLNKTSQIILAQFLKRLKRKIHEKELIEHEITALLFNSIACRFVASLASRDRVYASLPTTYTVKWKDSHWQPPAATTETVTVTASEYHVESVHWK